MSGMGRPESKAEKERHKQIQDKCQALLTEMLRDEDNKYCVDCDAKGPRWASWNLGVFLCIRCAGIHRNLGVHISRVKSVNLDSWTPEQVVSLQQMGNSRARAVYEASLPDTWRRPQTDSNLESFIRAKYQQKRYIAKEWVPAPLPKVDWDKELDEEAERQKKRKKEKNTVTIPPIRKAIPEIPVPALPKPMSSPKSSRTSASTASANTDDGKKSSSIDLLGLNTAMAVPANSNGSSDDAFTNFLSAPPPAAASVAPAVDNATAAKGRSAEEDSFFNQPAPPTNQGKKTLSKDSIMALYTSAQTAPPPQQNLFQNPGIFPVAPTMGFPTVNPMFSNGIPGVMPTGTPMQQPGANPFFGMTAGVMPQQSLPMQHGSSSTPLSKPSDDLLADFGFPTSSPSLPQQMAGLNLNPGVAPTIGAMAPTAFPPMQGGFPAMPNFMPPAAPSSMGQTFTTHLWQ